MSDELQAHLARMVAEDVALVEEACEASLTGGEHGVLVCRENGRVSSAAPDRRVPYGMIYEYDLDALRRLRPGQWF
jgi:hypothetical protein